MMSMPLAVLYSSFFILYLSSSSPPHCNCAPVVSPFNLHTYDLILTPVTFNDALALLSSPSSPHPPESYLATITSQIEYDWIVDTFLLPYNVSFWIGLEKESTWSTYRWVGGPEKGYLASRQSTLDCPYFCAWDWHRPDNRTGDETAICMSIYNHGDEDGDSGRWNILSDTSLAFEDLPPNTVLLPYLIEIGNDSVLVYGAPTSGDSILIRGFGLPLWSTLLALYNDTRAWNVTVGTQQCTVTSLSKQDSYPPTIECYARGGSGSSLPLTISYYENRDNASSSPTILLKDAPLFSYYRPQVTSVSYVAVGIPITLVGSNFGTAASNIIIMLGYNECTSIVVMVRHTTLRCFVSDVSGPILPVTITVNGVKASTSVPLIYNPVNGHSYRQSMLWHTYVGVLKQVQPLTNTPRPGNSTAYENGYLVTITTPQERDFLFMNYHIHEIGAQVWIGADDRNGSGVYRWSSSSYSPDSSLIVYDGGMTSRNYSLLAYEQGFPIVGGGNNQRQSLLLSYFTGLCLSDASNKFEYRALIEYGTKAVATITKVNVQGGMVTITGLPFGPVASDHVILVGIYKCVNVTTVDSFVSLACMMPPGLGQGLGVLVTYYDNVLTTTSQQQQQVGRPLLQFSYDSWCDDGVCDYTTGETCTSCPSDCGGCAHVCGDNACEPDIGEDCLTCTVDCGSCPVVTCPGSPTECFGNGRCVLGTCVCELGYGGSDCLLKVVSVNVTGDGIDTVIVPSKSGNDTTSPTSPPQFTFTLLELIEVDMFDGVVAVTPLRGKASLPVALADIRLFFDIIDDDRVDDDEEGHDVATTTYPMWQYDIGLHPDIPSSKVSLQIVSFEQGMQGLFGSHDLSLPANSIKCTIIINDYRFVNTTNKLQITMASTASHPAPSPPSYVDACGRTQMMTSSGSSSQDNQLTWLSIFNSDGDSLYSQYPRYTLLDGRESTCHVTAGQQEGVVAITVPYFTSYVVIDPNFAVLVNPSHIDFKPSEGLACQPSSSLHNSGSPPFPLRELIIGVVCGVVGVAILVAAALFVKRKRHREKITRALDRRSVPMH
eukprot:TRINITY_DN4093_c0_g1_i1.p1 TRINITY_DN4093_c0_g1~~TRINITY_DN4093_c0_g1_i1.p1  ORF type:complete len:1054 (+),score=163.30 TRINITY_DN4093_c0_g1_i1:1-3162(+)